MSAMQSHMLLLANDAELSAADRVWGTGGWYPPEQREALDWLTLARLAGWSVSLARASDGGFEGDLATGTHWIVLASDPDALDDAAVDRISSRLHSDAVLFVTRAARAGSALARLAGAARSDHGYAGRTLEWRGPGAARSWVARGELHGCRLDAAGESTPWVTLDGTPLVCARRVGAGIAVTLGFNPSEARDLAGCATSAMRHLLAWGSLRPVAWLDFEHTMVLRMDDPGGAQNVHLNAWRYPKLTESAWHAISADLRRRNARLSIAYVAGWVDDGDAARGDLSISGRPAQRAAGQVYPSPQVRYEERTAKIVHDYESEYRGILALIRDGAGDVELHGYTHMHPDSRLWAAAPDRYQRVGWFREFGATAHATIASRPAGQHPLALGMCALRSHFNATPTTLISPGDEWTNDTLGKALDLGLKLVSSYYLALRHAGRFCWSVHVCAPYLDEPAASWFDSGLPVVGYFHDKEPALEGAGWLTHLLDRWQDAGAQRFIDFRELAALIERRYDVALDGTTMHISIDTGNAPALVRPFPLMLRTPGQQLPAQAEVCQDGDRARCAVEAIAAELGRVVIAA